MMHMLRTGKATTFSLLTFCLLLTAGFAGGQTLAATYQPVADKLIAASLADPEGYSNLQYLCDHIGKRISGSEPLARAIVWATSS